jgi:hypothetical protein
VIIRPVLRRSMIVPMIIRAILGVKTRPHGGQREGGNGQGEGLVTIMTHERSP